MLRIPLSSPAKQNSTLSPNDTTHCPPEDTSRSSEGPGRSSGSDGASNTGKAYREHHRIDVISDGAPAIKQQLTALYRWRLPEV
jgi:hypothetical protein